MIVDDEANFGESLQLALEDDYEISVAHSIEEARRLFREKLPDVALIDVMLPDGNGVDLLSELRTHGEMPVSIIMTAYSMLEGSAKAFREGATDYIIKPFKIDELKREIFRHLHKKFAGPVCHAN